MIKKLAIWYLRKRKTSVVAGVEIKNGEVQSLNNHTLMYDNTMINSTFKSVDGNPLIIPEGKFSIKRPNKR